MLHFYAWFLGVCCRGCFWTSGTSACRSLLILVLLWHLWLLFRSYLSDSMMFCYFIVLLECNWRICCRIGSICFICSCWCWCCSFVISAFSIIMIADPAGTTVVENDVDKDDDLNFCWWLLLYSRCFWSGFVLVVAAYALIKTIWWFMLHVLMKKVLRIRSAGLFTFTFLPT